MNWTAFIICTVVAILWGSFLFWANISAPRSHRDIPMFLCNTDGGVFVVILGIAAIAALWA